MRARQRHLNAKDLGASLVLDARFLALANGSNVTTWTNRVGRDNFTSNSSPSIYMESALNGQPVVRFSGSSTGYYLLTSTWYNQSRIFIFTGKMNGFGPAYSTLYDDYSSNSGVTCGFSLLVKSNGKLAIYWGATDSQVSYDGTGSTTLNTSTKFIWSAGNGPSVFYSLINGASDASLTTTKTPKVDEPPPPSVGYSRTFPGRNANMDLGQALIVNGSTSTSVRKRLEQSAAFSFKISCS